MFNDDYEVENKVQGTETIEEDKNDYDFIDEIMRRSKKRKIIAAVSIITVFICLIGFVVGIPIYQKKASAEHNYFVINQLYEKKDYLSALSEIVKFNETCSQDSKKVTKKVNQLYMDIEDDLYYKAKNEMSEEMCKVYLEYYKDGRYIQAINDIQEKIKQKQLKEKEEAEKLTSLVYLDDFIKKHDDVIKENGWNEGRCLSNDLYKVRSREHEELPLTEHYPTIHKEYRYKVDVHDGVEWTSIDIFTNSKDEILYLGYKIDKRIDGTDLLPVYQSNCGALFAAVTNQKWKDAYNVLGTAWNNANDGNTYNDILSCGNYEYFFSSSADGKYAVFVIRAKIDN